MEINDGVQTQVKRLLVSRLRGAFSIGLIVRVLYNSPSWHFCTFENCVIHAVLRHKFGKLWQGTETRVNTCSTRTYYHHVMPRTSITRWKIKYLKYQDHDPSTTKTFTVKILLRYTHTWQFTPNLVQTSVFDGPKTDERMKRSL